MEGATLDEVGMVGIGMPNELIYLDSIPTIPTFLIYRKERMIRPG